jgi:hypothetical protein
MTSTLLRAVMLLTVGAVLAACAPVTEPAAPPVVETPTGADVYGGFPVDPPAADEVVLTLVGTRTVDLTMGELDAMAVREVTFVEPFVKVEQTFRVVPLADLLALAGIGPDDVVDTIALNDYRFRDGSGALVEADALLAVGRDGGPIPMDAGGPVRLVFDVASPYHGLLDAWNWSLRTIRVVSAP